MGRLVIQKFGGSVLVDEQAFVSAAQHVARTIDEGSRVVAVVSALAGKTDGLLNSAKRMQENPDPETMDLLLATGELQSVALMTLALAQLNIQAQALNPWQVGVHTDGSHGDARITRINPLTLRTKLATHPAVIVPGFLGRREDFRITTLGRGGSDLSAVALAVALEAEACEFFKDVPGYFSADPKCVRNVLHRPFVTGAEAFELSRFGCRFLQDRAIAWAVESRCHVRLRALGEDSRATVLCDKPPEGHPGIVAMTHCKAPAANQGENPEPEKSLISLVGCSPGRNPDPLEAAISKRLGDLEIESSRISRSENRITFAVRSQDLQPAQQAVHDLCITPHADDSTRVRRRLREA
ncbi:MAG: hypothetical protein ABIK28_11270 [Planctomycetota bacterium]